MSAYVIVGAGPMGRAVASLLVEEGHRVRMVTRSGSGPEHELIERVALDVTRVSEFSALVVGSDALFNCANPRYHRWITDWPPIARSLQTAAADTGAVLVTLSNLYVYGQPEGPMSSDSPLRATYEKARVRATMWREALAAHESGRLRATEVRASDFIGPNADSVVGDRLVSRVLKGQRCWALGASDQPHSWSYTNDVARTLVTCSRTPEAWGQVWHAPTNVPRTQHEVIDDFADAAHVRRVKVSTIPNSLLRLVGIVSPVARELPLTLYQFEAPFVIDDAPTRNQLGLEPTPWSEVVHETVAAYR